MTVWIECVREKAEMPMQLEKNQTHTTSSRETSDAHRNSSPVTPQTERYTAWFPKTKKDQVKMNSF